MKNVPLFTAAAIITTALLITSCGPSREYYSKSSPRSSRSYYSLIVSPSPGFTMNRNTDGRFYHRSPQGYLYWQGNDNRFYLDRKFLNKVSYSKWEYNDWKRYNKEKYYKGRRR
jgi:hypothetical protein